MQDLTIDGLMVIRLEVLYFAGQIESGGPLMVSEYSWYAACITCSYYKGSEGMSLPPRKWKHIKYFSLVLIAIASYNLLINSCKHSS